MTKTITSDEACEILGFKQKLRAERLKKLRSLVKSGNIKMFQKGRPCVFDREEIKDLYELIMTGKI